MFCECDLSNVLKLRDANINIEACGGLEFVTSSCFMMTMMMVMMDDDG